MDTDYLTVLQLKGAIEPGGMFDSSTDNSLYQRAISASSRLIDEWCGRHFWRTTTTEARLFQADTAEWLCVDDFDDTTDLVVKTDADFDGVFETTWSASDWVAYPYVRVNGWPYHKLFAVGAKRFPVGNRRAGVQATNRWGWGSIIMPVEQSCELLSVALYKGKDFMSDPKTVWLAAELVYPYARDGGLLCDEEYRRKLKMRAEAMS